MTQPPFDLAKAHRWFAVECNNEAWALLERPARTAGETERAIHAAHAALVHWAEVGTPVNRLRGLSLLVSAYTAGGREEEAIRWAGVCLALAEELGAGGVSGGQHQAAKPTAFDLACAHAAAAGAFRLGGFTDEASEHEAGAREALGACDAEERELVKRLYAVGA